MKEIKTIGFDDTEMIRSSDDDKLKPQLMFPADLDWDEMLFLKRDWERLSIKEKILHKSMTIYCFIASHDKEILNTLVDFFNAICDYVGYAEFLEACCERYTKKPKEYEDRNWERGWSSESVLERYGISLMRHTMSWCKGETDENHLGAMGFNLQGIYHWLKMNEGKDGKNK